MGATVDVHFEYIYIVYGVAGVFFFRQAQKTKMFFENPKSSRKVNVYTDNIKLFGAGVKYLSILGAP